MNSTIVSRMRGLSPAGRGYRRGPLLCCAIVMSGAAAMFSLPQARKSTNLRAPTSSTGGARLAVAGIADHSAAHKFANMGWAFEPNLGQSASAVKFLARAHDATVFLTRDSLYISWAHRKPEANSAADPKADLLQLQFADASRAAATSGESLLPGKTNYLIGRNPRDWRTDVPHYRGVRYADLYPGIDARVYGGSQGLEYDLTAKPGANLHRILLRAKGAERLRLDSSGNLLLLVGTRQMTMKRPQIYQMENGARVRVSGGYKLLAANEIGFEIGKHRPDLPLVIDPTISIAYTTFLGGSGAEKGNSVAVDSSGDVYVGGTTTSVTTFPEATTCNDIKSTACGGTAVSATSNLFVAKVNMTTTPPTLQYLTFIGGSGNDQGGMVAVDNSASPPNLAILGWTTSTDFPVTISAPNPGSALNGPSDLTVTDLNGNGNGLVYSEYFGGSGAEATQNAGGIATDAAGDVFVTSDTSSVDFPTTLAFAFHPVYGGSGNDDILAEFAAGTGTLTYSTYLGLDASTIGSTGVAVDASGNAYVAGFTSSTAVTFSSGFQPTYPGGSLDGFVMKINPAVPGPTGLVYGTFIGGSQSDKVTSIALDTAALPNAYVAGITQSSDLIPTSGATNAPFQPSLGTGAVQNGFFAVINQSVGPPVTPSLQYITYLGGGTADAAESVAVVLPATPGPSTQVYVAGNATSANFPSLCSLQGFSGTQDAFVAEFNPSLGSASPGKASLLSATLLGGTATAEANAVSADASGNAILFGDSVSSDYPLASKPQNGFQPICSSCQLSPAESDAFLTKVAVGPGTAGCIAFSPTVATFGSFADGTSAPPLAVQVTNVGDGALNVSSVTVTGANSTDFSLTNNSCITASPIAPAGICNFSVTFTPSIIGPEAAAVQMTDDGVASPQILNLNGTGTGVGVTLSPGSSLSFPSTVQGVVSAEQTITLTNTGADNLVIQTSPPIQGTNAADFEFGSSNTCVVSSTISPGGTCTIAVQFAPNEPNPPAGGVALSAQDVLTLLDAVNGSMQTITISLSGTETPATPTIVFAPVSLTFTSENVGSPTASQPLTITNTGSAALSISSIGITGTNPGDFSQTNNCPIQPATLAINANCVISITFQPTATGPRSAAVSVADNAASSPQTVALSGTGTAAGVSLTPSSLTFAGQNPGTPASAPQTVTLQNTGNGPLTISGISITGANVADFAETDNCPKGPSATLGSGSACSIAITFAPKATGQRSATLSVSDDAVPSPQVVSLSGLGTAPGAKLNVSTISFSPTIVGTQSTTSPVQVNNTGNGPLVIASVSFTGANPGDFQASGSCVGANGAAVSVAAASSCTVNVVFAPAAAGSRSATLNVNDNASGSPQQLSASGTATDFQLALGSSGSTSVTVNAGETATFNLQASPLNGFSGALAMSCADPIPASTCTVSPQQVNVSGSQGTAFTAAITTTARTASFSAPFFAKPPGARNLLLAGLGLLAFAFLGLWKRRRRAAKRLRLGFLFAGALLLCSCGGGGSSPSANGTPAGTYNVTVNGAISGTTRSITLSVTVQ